MSLKGQTFVIPVQVSFWAGMVEKTGLSADGGFLPEKSGVQLSYAVTPPVDIDNPDGFYVVVFKVEKAPFYVSLSMIQNTLADYVAKEESEITAEESVGIHAVGGSNGNVSPVN